MIKAVASLQKWGKSNLALVAEPVDLVPVPHSHIQKEISHSHHAFTQIIEMRKHQW